MLHLCQVTCLTTNVLWLRTLSSESDLGLCHGIRMLSVIHSLHGARNRCFLYENFHLSYRLPCVDSSPPPAKSMPTTANVKSKQRLATVGTAAVLPPSSWRGALVTLLAEFVTGYFQGALASLTTPHSGFSESAF